MTRINDSGSSNATNIGISCRNSATQSGTYANAGEHENWFLQFTNTSSCQRASISYYALYNAPTYSSSPYVRISIQPVVNDISIAHYAIKIKRIG